jgi:hypothetical protein
MEVENALIDEAKYWEVLEIPVGVSKFYSELKDNI